MVASESNLFTGIEQAGSEVRSSITKSADLLTQKTMAFEDRCSVQQRGHSPAGSFTYISGSESQTGFQCTCCHQGMGLK